jgi:3-phenylpropionate/trans-cinnamate dioxygenase ferredoxin subunit
MDNGRNTSGEGYYMKHWPVDIRDEGVFVGMEDAGGLFG